jgi:hypothetical protein
MFVCTHMKTWTVGRRGATKLAKTKWFLRAELLTVPVRTIQNRGRRRPFGPGRSDGRSYDRCPGMSEQP